MEIYSNRQQIQREFDWLRNRYWDTQFKQPLSMTELKSFMDSLKKEMREGKYPSFDYFYTISCKETSSGERGITSGEGSFNYSYNAQVPEYRPFPSLFPWIFYKEYICRVRFKLIEHHSKRESLSGLELKIPEKAEIEFPIDFAKDIVSTFIEVKQR